jgi:hypothetical protein
MPRYLPCLGSWAWAVTPTMRTRVSTPNMPNSVLRCIDESPLLAPIQPTHRPYPLPELGQQSADHAHRDGVAERGPEPAGPTSLAGALALLGPDDARLRQGERSGLKTAQRHEANPWSLLRPVPGIGAMLRLGLLSAIPDSQRFPPRARCGRLLPPGARGPGVGRQALRPRGHPEGPCLSSMGLLGSREALLMGHSCGAAGAGPLRANPWEEESVERPHPSMNPGGV